MNTSTLIVSLMLVCRICCAIKGHALAHVLHAHVRAYMRMHVRMCHALACMHVRLHVRAVPVHACTHGLVCACMHGYKGRLCLFLRLRLCLCVCVRVRVCVRVHVLVSARARLGVCVCARVCVCAAHSVEATNLKNRAAVLRCGVCVSHADPCAQVCKQACTRALQFFWDWRTAHTCSNRRPPANTHRAERAPCKHRDLHVIRGCPQKRTTI